MRQNLFLGQRTIGIAIQFCETGLRKRIKLGLGDSAVAICIQLLKHVHAPHAALAAMPTGCVDRQRCNNDQPQPQCAKCSCLHLLPSSGLLCVLTARFLGADHKLIRAGGDVPSRRAGFFCDIAPQGVFASFKLALASYV